MEDALLERLRALRAAEPSAGYRALHAKLKEEPEFQEVGLKKVQTALQRLKSEATEAPGGYPMAHAPPSVARKASPGENIWTAASDGDIARVEELMEIEGLTPNSADESGYTPLHAAASWGRIDLLRLLLQRGGALVNIVDTDGDTPLHHVAQASELEAEQIRPIVELLLEHRADPTIQNDEQKTCLDVCGEEVVDGEDEEPVLNIEFIKILADHGYKLDESGDAVFKKAKESQDDPEDEAQDEPQESEELCEDAPQPGALESDARKIQD